MAIRSRMRTARNDPHRLVSEPDYKQAAQQAGQRAGRGSSGGRGELTPGTMEPIPGTQRGPTADVLQRAVGGAKVTEDYTPVWVPGVGNQPGFFAESTMERTIESPLSMADVVRTAIGDIQAQSRAQAGARERGRKAIGGVQAAYGGEGDRIQEAVEEARQIGRAEYGAAAEERPEIVEGVREAAVAERERAQEKAEELTEMATGFREQRLDALKNQAALAATTTRRGAETQLNRALQEVDRLAAVGEIPDPEGRKAQVRAAHREHLGQVQATLSVEYNKIADAARASADAYTLNIAAVAESRAQTTGVATVEIQRKLAELEVQERQVGMQQQQMREIAYVQMDLAASQLRASGAELEAEILLSPAMAETAEEYAPLIMMAVEAYETEEQANIASREDFWTQFGAGGATQGAQVQGMFQGPLWGNRARNAPQQGRGILGAGGGGVRQIGRQRRTPAGAGPETRTSGGVGRHFRGE